ncbi:prolipoprotein diacylglyceryl transferase [archaeon]|nr:prolipoprotein diacylglyceryl transferase [archaeon]
MWIHNLNPTLLNLGPLEIRYYGLVYILGFIILTIWLVKFRNKINLTKDQAYDFSFYLMLGVILGSRLFHVLVWETAYYLADPIKILYIWEGGMAFHGGLIGALVAGYFFCKKYKISLLKAADLVSIPAVIVLALGRIANFINAELPGTVTSLPWCVDFGDSQCRHPVQIYSALKRFAVAGVLILLSRKHHKPGFIFFSMVALLGLGRFLIDFYREDTLYLALSIGQWSSLAMFIVGITTLIIKYKKEIKTIFVSFA